MLTLHFQSGLISACDHLI